MEHVDVPTQRICTKCREIKPLDDFSAAPRGKYGRKASCKACDAARHAELHPPKPRVYRPLRAPLVGTAEKRCTKCKEIKTVDEFSVSRVATATTNVVYRSWCKPCASTTALDWFNANRERADENRRRWNIKKLYGITVEEYDELLKKQGKVCAICGDDEPLVHGRTGKQFRLAVDHCHTTGRVRGLLCQKCNRAIGLLRDNIDLLRKAADYLERE